MARGAPILAAPPSPVAPPNTGAPRLGPAPTPERTRARLLSGGGLTLITFAAGASIALQTAAAWWLLTRVLGFRQTLDRGRDAGMLLLVALACGMLRTAFEMPMLVHAIAQPVAGRELELFVFASVGYAMGVMLVAPPILAWAHHGLRRRSEWHAAEAAAVTLLILVTASWCFAAGQDGGRIQMFGLIILPARCGSRCAGLRPSR